MPTGKEYRHPQYPKADPFAKLFEFLGLVTKDPNKKYPLAIRRERARQYHRYFEGILRKHRIVDRETARKIKKEGNNRKSKELARQFTQNQKDMLVHTEGFGDLSARYVILLDKERDKPKSLIFLIPGISNDLEGSGSLGYKLAMEGHQVVILSYPESWYGTTTDKFAEAVETDPEFNPHTAFFEQMITNIIENENLDPTQTESGLELWGHSTGSVIVAKLLKQEKYKKSVRRAVLCNPAACVNISKVSLRFHGLRDLIRGCLSKSFPYLNPLPPTTVTKTEEKRALMLRTFYALKDSVLAKYPWWKDIELENGEIFVVSATEDGVTRSQEALPEIRQTNPNLKIREIPGPHTVALTQPEKVIAAISSSEEN